MSQHEKKANDFLKKVNATIEIEFLKNDFHFEGDKEKRDVYKVTITRGQRQYSFNFGQSIAKKGTPPTNYSVLACLQKYDVGTFENFCGDFGYDEDSRQADKLYKAVCEEYKSLCALFNDDEMNELAEIN